MTEGQQAILEARVGEAQELQRRIHAAEEQLRELEGVDPARGVHLERWGQAKLESYSGSKKEFAFEKAITEQIAKQVQEKLVAEWTAELQDAQRKFDQL